MKGNMKITKNFAVRATRIVSKLSQTVRAAAADVVVLDDLREAVSAAAKGDERFNRTAAGSPADGNWTPWCTSIEFDQDDATWAAVVNAADGKFYRVGFDLSSGGKVTLNAEGHEEVARKTEWVAARCLFNDVAPAVRATMPSGPTASQMGKESPEQQAAARRANLKSSIADAHEEAYPDGESHGSKQSAHQNAMYSHQSAAEQSSAGPVKDFHKAAADYHRQMAEDHGKVVAKEAAPVRAAGTAGGAQSGHYARKATAADEASQEAHDASAEAHDSGEDEDHEAASEAHGKASDAHQAAMVAAAKAAKTADAKRHAQLMNMHDACADAHAGDDDAAVEAASTALSEAINGGSANGSTVDDMDKDAVHCRASTGVRIQPTEAWSTGQEAKMVYLPAGISTICAGFRDGAINLTVDVDEDTAKTVQKSYDDLRASYPKLEPFFCFEHREEEASFHPRRFEWGEVRGEQGVLAAGEPTELGATNVNGRVHRTFSPSFTTDAEYGKAVERNGVLSFPDGVRGSKTNPAKITGIAFCAGTLTNKPAFKNMPPVKAKAATPPEPKKRPTSEEVFARISKTQSEQPEAVRAKKIEDIFARVGGKTGAPPSK